MSHYPDERAALYAEDDRISDAIEAIKHVAEHLDGTTFAWCPVCGFHHCGERCKAAECFEASSISVTTDTAPRMA